METVHVKVPFKVQVVNVDLPDDINARIQSELSEKYTVKNVDNIDDILGNLSPRAYHIVNIPSYMDPTKEIASKIFAELGKLYPKKNFVNHYHEEHKLNPVPLINLVKQEGDKLKSVHDYYVNFLLETDFGKNPKKH